MGRFLVGLLFVLSAVSQPLPNLGWGNTTAGYMWYGPTIVYPGYSHYYGFPNTRWRVPVTCSATGNTCNTAGSGYTPTGTENGVFVTATVLPAGLETLSAGAFATYSICNVSGTQFKLCHNGTSTVETFSSAGSGVSLLITPASITTHGYIISNTGWPAGTILKWGNTNGSIGWLQDAFISANGNPFNYTNLQAMLLKATIPNNATPGNYTITITTCTIDATAGVCTGGLSDTLTFTITVTAITYLSDANEPASFPPIPGLSTWVNYMTSSGTGGGADWCNKTTGATNPANVVAGVGTDSLISYYDGGNSYWRISQWTRDPAWQNCSQNILQQIGWGNANSAGSNPPGYLIQNNGAVPGYRVFPRGYSVAVSQDPRYIAPLQYMAGLMSNVQGGGGGDSWTIAGCSPLDAHLRENSYAFELMLTIDEMQLTPTNDYPGLTSEQTWAAREQRCADEIISSLTYYVSPEKRFATHQYFMDGLALNTLIHWHHKTKDPRVPMVTKLILDQYYSHYNVAAHIAMWDPEPNGVLCLNAPTWYSPNQDGHCLDNTSTNITVLHNLVGHAFAWYWRISGDDTYRIEGDEVFSHGLDTDAFKGKDFNQEYKYSFNYVGWRQGWLSPDQSIE